MIPSCCAEHIHVPECDILLPETSDCPLLINVGGIGFDEYQKLAFTTAIYPNKGNNIYYPALGLGEVGEVQGKIKKIMRDDNGVVTDKKREEIKKEVGDVLWYIAALATEMGLSLSDIAQSNLNKLFDRKERGVIKGSGDDR